MLLGYRKLENYLQQLEMFNGLEAPRTGGISRLRSKLLGLHISLYSYVDITSLNFYNQHVQLTPNHSTNILTLK